MKIVSKLYDKRISAQNVLTEMTIKEYSKIAKTITKNNEYQRKRIKGSATVYKLLRTDLKSGCLIPPIVLAIRNVNLEKVLNPKNLTDEAITSLIKPENLIILDGLQRTFTLFDLINDLKVNDAKALEELYNNILRIEVYLGLNKIGILYRMLTLNTGQSPMSIRHQIEILYSDYLNTKFDGIELFREVEEKKAKKIGEYNFKDAIEGFNSYLDRDEIGINRSDLLENIQNLETLANENQKIDLFKEFIKSYNQLLLKLSNITQNYDYRKTKDYDKSDYVFGNDIFEIFSKSQSLTGFGAAIGNLKYNSIIKGFEDLNKNIDKLKFDDNPEEVMWQFLQNLTEIRNNAKNIGFYQRVYFRHFFNELFNSKGDSFLNVDKSVNTAYKLYKIQVSY